MIVLNAKLKRPEVYIYQNYSNQNNLSKNVLILLTIFFPIYEPPIAAANRIGM
jgi:hypothetical protein